MRRVAFFSGVWIVLLSIAARAAYYNGDDKDKDRFAPGAASSYKGTQTTEKIATAAVPFLNETSSAPPSARWTRTIMAFCRCW